jgi:hypothetical protein
MQAFLLPNNVFIEITSLCSDQRRALGSGTLCTSSSKLLEFPGLLVERFELQLNQCLTAIEIAGTGAINMKN